MVHTLSYVSFLLGNKCLVRLRYETEYHYEKKTADIKVCRVISRKKEASIQPLHYRRTEGESGTPKAMSLDEPFFFFYYYYYYTTSRSPWRVFRLASQWFSYLYGSIDDLSLELIARCLPQSFSCNGRYFCLCFPKHLVEIGCGSQKK